MNKMLDSLRQFLASTSKEKVKEIWSSGDYLDSGGLKVTEFLSMKGFNVKIYSSKINFETLKINDKLGSDSYSNLFYLINNLWSQPLSKYQTTSLLRLS